MTNRILLCLILALLQPCAVRAQIMVAIAANVFHGGGGGSFPTTSVLDDFMRANESPLTGNWTNQMVSGTGGINLTSNQLVCGGVFCSAYWNAATFGPDMEAYFTIPTVGATGSCVSTVLRGSGTGATFTGYLLFACKSAGTDTFEFYGLNNTTFTMIGSTINQEFSNGDSIGASIVGTTLKAYYQAGAGAWTEIGSETDATYSGTGFIGLTMDNTAYRVTQFGGGTHVP